MKKVLALVAVLFFAVSVYSQTVTLTFTGRGIGGNQTEEIYQQIDSLLISNITRHWEQMIYYPDTVLIMEALAVPMINVETSGLEQNVPNPFDCVTEAELNLSADDKVSIFVTDANGRNYLTFNENLPAGSHRFEIILAVPQTYFLTAQTSRGKHTIKMVNLGSCGTNSISLKSSADVQVISKSLIENEFDFGDEMDYFAYTTYNDIVFTGSRFQPQNDSEEIKILFEIPYCTRTINIDYQYACEQFTWINGETYYETNHNGPVMTFQSAGGCDSVVMLDLTIGYPYLDEKDTIRACQPITWNGQTLSQTGTYFADLISSTNCDSTVQLYFVRISNVTHEFSASHCERYVWNGQTYTETGDYQQTFEGQYGCDSIVTLHFTNTSNDIVDNITACDSIRWNGTNYFTSNNTAVVNLTNQFGCDSIVRLNLTMGYSNHSETSYTSCGAGYYNGELYTESGRYTQILTNSQGCDSTLTLNVTINDQTVTDIYESACESFTYNGQTYTESGTYENRFEPRENCDSIVNLHLEISHHTYADINVEECDSYTWFGQTYTESGDYTHRLTNSQGCDSICNLHLTLKRSVTNTVNIIACDSYMLDGQEITESGAYNVTYESQATNGCDSIVTYNVDIRHNEEAEFTVYACGFYTWNDETFDVAGDYERHLISIAGCDSLVTLHLILGTPNYDIVDVQQACGSYTWEGETYTESGNYTKTLENIYGCDSVVTLQLTIYDSFEITDNQTVCDSYIWEGDTYTESGTYTKILQTGHGCDSIITLHLTVNYSTQSEFSDTSCGPYIWDGRTYSATGDFEYTYIAQNGCDSVVTLHLVYHELVTDSRDGNTYCTMEYGNQVWMTENMKYLPSVGGSSSTSTARYYVYGYTGTNTTNAKNNANYETYGVLYNQIAAQTACPAGWHLPSQSEWQELAEFLSEEGNYCGSDESYVAKALASNTLWTTNSSACAVGNDLSTNNSSQFNALPGGYLSITGQLDVNDFTAITQEANWWTSTSNASTTAVRIMIDYNLPNLTIDEIVKHRGYSVRCVKDQE